MIKYKREEMIIMHKHDCFNSCIRLKARVKKEDRISPECLNCAIFNKCGAKELYIDAVGISY